VTTQDYSKVGQALAYFGGAELRFSKYWSFIIGAGATTPLSRMDIFQA
jgi:hypothetical protein